MAGRDPEQGSEGMDMDHNEFLGFAPVLIPLFRRRKGVLRFKSSTM